MYTYPTRRWKKKKRCHHQILRRLGKNEETLGEMHTISTVKNVVAATRLNGICDVDETSTDQWSGYEDEQLTDLIKDPNDPEAHRSESSDFEDV